MRLCVSFLCFSCGAGLFGQSTSAEITTTLIDQPLTPAKVIALTVGRGQLLQFSQDLIRVVVAEPKVADAIVVSPREVMVAAKGAGKTSLAIWEGNGMPPVRFDINVGLDEEADNKHKVDFTSELKATLPDSTIRFDGNSETMVLTGDAPNQVASKKAEALAATRSKKVINLITVPPPPDPRQIMLQVRFASIDRTALAELGFNFISRNSKLLGAGSTEQFATPRIAQLQTTSSSTSVNFSDLLNLFLFRPDLNIGATIRALQQRNLAEILAEPNLIVVEGKEASFLAGGQFPFPTLTSTTTGGATAPVVTVQFKNFGVQLDFTPTVTASGAINLKVAPQVTALDFSNAVTVQGTLIPAISARKAETEVVLRDGESFAIAGLIDNRVIKEIDKIKWLGDIPIIGQLFKSTSTKKTNSELLVVVTPHFVRPLSVDEKAKMPEMPEAFLPTVAQEQAKKKRKKDKQAEVVGKRGYQKPPAQP